jgi:nucleotide-binding universal stress UspA family protein
MLANTQLPRLLALGARLSCMRRSPSPRVTTRSAPTRTEFSKAVDGNAFVKSSWVAAIVDDLAPAERDIVIEGKRGLDTFASTNLDFILRSKGITTLVLGRRYGTGRSSGATAMASARMSIVRLPNWPGTRCGDVSFSAYRYPAVATTVALSPGLSSAQRPPSLGGAMSADTGSTDSGLTPREQTAPSAGRRHERLALVVGHDGHPASNAALTTAVDLAQRLGAHLHVVHSVTLDDYGIDPDIEDFEDERDRNVARERVRIAAALANASIPWTYHEERGDPVHQIARLAHDVDASFIIVGATHRGVLHHLSGGHSVSKRLLHLQPRPVIVVPASSTH